MSSVVTQRSFHPYSLANGTVTWLPYKPRCLRQKIYNVGCLDKKFSVLSRGRDGFLQRAASPREFQSNLLGNIVRYLELGGVEAFSPLEIEHRTL